MPHGHHHREEEEEREEERYERREEREEERYERRQERENELAQGYGRRTAETEYVPEGGGYGRRREEYEERPGGYTRHTVTEAEERLDGIERARREETSYQRTERLGEFGAVVGTGMALYERHEQEVDPTNVGRHKMEERIAEGLVGVGGGAALYGHHKKENSEERLEELESGHKKHGWFG